MSIILARIDDRLIHGQVTEGWCAKLKPDIILVVSDEVSSSDWLSDLCLAALPTYYKGIVTSISDAHNKINELDKTLPAAYVLFESPKDVFTVIENGARLTEVNVGGMHSTKGKREILDYIFVDDNDIKYLKLLQDRGIKLDFRDLPDTVTFDVMTRL